MPAPVVHINGHPGSGKLTIAQALQGIMPGAHLLDNHTLLDPARALFERGTPELINLREIIRAAVFQAANQLDPVRPLLLTDALDDSTYGSDLFFNHIVPFTKRTNRQLFRVILDIDEDENVRRIQSPTRRLRRKLTDPEVLREGRASHRILGAGDPDVFHLNVTAISPEVAAKHIHDHLATGLPYGQETAQ